MKMSKRAKKIMTTLMAMSIATSMTVPVLAEGNTGTDPAPTESTVITGSTNQTGPLDLVYTEDNYYKVSIPKQLVLSPKEVVNTTITASELNIDSNKVLNVTISEGMSGAGIVTLTHQKDSSVKTTSTVSLISGGAGISDTTPVACFSGIGTDKASETEGTGTLYFSELTTNSTIGTTSVLKAGSYKGQITFLFSIE